MAARGNPEGVLELPERSDRAWSAFFSLPRYLPPRGDIHRSRG